MKLATLLSLNRSNLALLIGNGINRYGTHIKGSSWDDLLNALARKYLDPSHKNVPKGISLTELYDVLDLRNSSESGEKNLQKQFCDLMVSWKPLPQHERIAIWARHHDVPVLTTNFESTLGDAVDCRLHRTRASRFTAYYPWDSYFSDGTDDDPCHHFAIWHINGMQRYRQSVRLGLSHYMGSVERARAWLHKGSYRLFSGSDTRSWAGASTWLQILFHKPLLIFGLALAENEVFLRWLLIERAKYYKKFPDRRQEAWYVHTPSEDDLGKLFFLTGVDVQLVEVKNYDEIYGVETWKLLAAK
ncbi:hypothetical protein [Sulfuriferula sp.]|uniref:hypothetical protein n=1 Tax=Sulfuriferula sp. TaxID=2025307 RepID=UPI0027315AA3|nr:hypothetical protein [Sulfuriferula sp.]MDP2024620.1 hypothetical protein [Sulfuriferula sp.]